MKWVIGSDIHGAAEYCRQFLEACDREGAERILLLGDILYHGPRNDLPEAYDPKRVMEFPIMAEYAYLCAEGVSVFATHGHHFNTKNPPPLRKGEFLLHGHTHVPAWEQREGYTYLNPGSTSIPKEGSPRGYMTLEDGIFRWKKLDGTVYHTL